MTSLAEPNYPAPMTSIEFIESCLGQSAQSAAASHVATLMKTLPQLFTAPESLARLGSSCGLSLMIFCIHVFEIKLLLNTPNTFLRPHFAAVSVVLSFLYKLNLHFMFNRLLTRAVLRVSGAPGHDFSRGPHPNPKSDYNLK